MSDNSNTSNTNNNTDTTSLAPINLLADFRKILGLFDRENQIYKEQISILKDTINTIQTNDDAVFNDITRELNELKHTLNNISGQIVNSKSTNNNTNGTTRASTSSTSSTNSTSTISPASATRQLTDYLCQICLDAPRDCLLEPCMHFCLCVSCVTRLPNNKCPVCRRPIDFYQNVFVS